MSAASAEAVAALEQRVRQLESQVLDLFNAVESAVAGRDLDQHKLNAVQRYRTLIERTQRARPSVNRTVVKEALALHKHGVPGTEIAMLMRVSACAISQIIAGKYPANRDLQRTDPAAGLEAGIEALLLKKRPMVVAAILHPPGKVTA